MILVGEVSPSKFPALADILQRANTAQKKKQSGDLPTRVLHSRNTLNQRPREENVYLGILLSWIEGINGRKEGGERNTAYVRAEVVCRLSVEKHDQEVGHVPKAVQEELLPLLLHLSSHIGKELECACAQSDRSGYAQVRAPRDSVHRRRDSVRLARTVRR